MLRDITGLVVALQVLASLQVFDQAVVMMDFGPGPEDSTRTFVRSTLEEGFTSHRVGHASAISVVFFVLIAAVALVRMGTAPSPSSPSTATAPLPLEVSLAGLGPTSVAGHSVLSDAGPDARNTVQDRERVKPHEATGTTLEGGVLRAVLEPLSWNVIRLV